MATIVFPAIIDSARALIPMAIVAIMTASAFGYGRWWVAWLDDYPRCTQAERRLYTITAGLGIMAFVTLGIGLLGLLYPVAIAAIPAIGLISLLYAIVRPRGSSSPPPSGPPTLGSAPGEVRRTNRLSASRVVLCGFLTVAFLLIGVGVLMPEFFHDALIYHLELPRYYLFHHRIEFLPWNYNSTLPATINMLYLIALAFSDEQATKLIHAGLAALCLVALVCLGSMIDRRLESSKLVGWLAGALFLSIPAILLLSTVSSIDLGLTLFELLALASWYRWQESDSHRSQTAGHPLAARRWLTLSGMMTGLALGTKYSAIFFVIGMLAAWSVFWIGQRSDRHRPPVIKSIGLWCGTALLTASPWYLKNILTTGDPFYPTFATQLAPTLIPNIGVELLRLDIGTGGIAVENWSDYFARLVTNDIGWLTVAAALGSSLLFFRLKRPQILTAIIAGSVISWWLMSPVPRYLTPTIALLTLLAASGLSHVASIQRSAGMIIGIVVVSALSWQLWLSAAIIRDRYLSPFTAITGLTALGPADIDGYPSNALPVRIMRNGPERHQWLSWSIPPYAVIDYANRELPDDAKVLFVAEYRGYYLNRDRVIATRYDRSPMITWVAASSTTEEVAERLQQEGITHILFNQIEARKLEQAGYPAYQWPSESSRALFERFRRERLTQLRVENGVFLYAIRH